MQDTQLASLRDKAASLRDCLHYTRQDTGRREHASDEDVLELSDPFLADEAKILSSKGFRRLGEKTQVFTLPKNALIRTRLAHVMEVVATSVVASDLLGLNTSLVRAAALGHDTGHVPFGHQGEMWMQEAMGKPTFCHEVLGPIIMQKIERSGRGLNLTHETLEAMMRHSGTMVRKDMSQEAWLLRYTDKFTYLFHDYNDIRIRARYPLPPEVDALAMEFGSTQRERTTTAIAALVIESAEAGFVRFEQSEWARTFHKFRKLMYEIYPRVTQQNVRAKLEPVVECLSLLGLGDPFLLLALMTDKDVVYLEQQPMKDAEAFSRTSVGEIAHTLRHIGPVDLCDPALDW